MILDSVRLGMDTRLVPEGWITVTEAAIRRGLKPQQIRDAIKRGHLYAERHGYVWLVRVEDVDALEIKPVGRPKRRRGRPPKKEN